jgi:predicted nucleotidyltransferase
VADNPLFESLRELCLFLDEAGIEHMLVGGLAVGVWSEPRATVDIDFLVATGLKDFENLKRKITASGRFIFIHDKPMTFGKISFLRAALKSNADVAVDFLFADDEFKNSALKRKETVQITGFSVNVSSPEDLIILKLLSDRAQDRLDAKKIIEFQKGHLDREYMQKWFDSLGIKVE